VSKRTFYEFIDGETFGQSAYLISLDDIAIVSPCKNEAYCGETFTIIFKQGGKVVFTQALGLYKALLKRIREEAEVLTLEVSGHKASAVLD
jgi:hypothetical protein